MKRFICVFIILLFCAASCSVLFACDADKSNEPVMLKDGMRAEDIFDLLERAFSYTIKVDGEDYRFIRGKGYTKFEDGVFDGLVAEDGTVFRMTTKDGAKVTTEPLNDEFYAEVDAAYEKYVRLLRDSFARMTSTEPVEFALGEKGYKASIRMILVKGAGEYSVVSCEISNVNSTVLFFPDELKDYKLLAENT